MQASNEDIDSAMLACGHLIIKAYTHKLVTDPQRARLSGYKQRKETQQCQQEDQKKLDQLALLEAGDYFEPICVYQHGMIPGRIVVASTQSYMDGKIERKKANGGLMIEIFKDRHPRAYALAQRYPLADDFI